MSSRRGSTGGAPLAARYTPPVPSVSQRREWGLRLIIAYKFVKAPIMLTLALWLTLAPGRPFEPWGGLAHELAEGGIAWARAGAVAASEPDASCLLRKAPCWPGSDSVSTGDRRPPCYPIGSSWRSGLLRLDWPVCCPSRRYRFEHRPGLGKFLVLLANAADRSSTWFDGARWFATTRIPCRAG